MDFEKKYANKEVKVHISLKIQSRPSVKHIKVKIRHFLIPE